MTDRFLIVNADDFGHSDAVNRGIIESHERGIVTSATLMVRSPAAADAASYAQRAPSLALGLHLDLAEWTFLRDEWVAAYEVVNIDDPDAVAAEVERQVERFHDLVGRSPTHLDSHQHVHRTEPVRSIVLEAARRFAVPLRHESSVAYCGDFYGQTGKGEPDHEAITVEALERVIEMLPSGWTELACHPGADDVANTTYAGERAMERRVLCEPRVRDAIARAEVELKSFADVAEP